jgi:hypothetical protein
VREIFEPSNNRRVQGTGQWCGRVPARAVLLNGDERKPIAGAAKARVREHAPL